MTGISYGRERGKKENGIFRVGKVGKLRLERKGNYFALVVYLRFFWLTS